MGIAKMQADVSRVSTFIYKFSFICRAGCYKIPALQKALNVGGNFQHKSLAKK